MITIKDIAKHAKVSVATVSYVLNNTRFVSPERRERVLSSIKELNYVPNAVARGLRAKSTKTLGLVLSDITNPFYPKLAKGCEDAAQAAGYSIIIFNTNVQRSRILSAVSHIREGKVDGLIFASTLQSDSDIVQDLIEEGYPIIFAHRRVYGIQADSVFEDNVGGMTSAVRYLQSLGHKKISMLTGMNGCSVSNDRKETFVKAMKNSGITNLEEWIRPTEDDYHLAYNVVMEMIKLSEEKRPTAFVCISDVIALAVMDAVEDMGFNVPTDFSVIGFEDQFFAETRRIGLTSVRVPNYEIGQHAVQILINRLTHPEVTEPVELVLPTRLIVRKTCQ
ncbi:LacI family DNA-binding transcriptional regulator [Brevibacillus sp. NRS-1366]|uniref:LacI family DNA-binding transcriptional regulator n=1 Tax=Brevibacillus sp. NRS-1366 TaxID=3233899 RepID=UPI003D239F4B